MDEGESNPSSETPKTHEINEKESKSEPDNQVELKTEITEVKRADDKVKGNNTKNRSDKIKDEIKNDINESTVSLKNEVVSEKSDNPKKVVSEKSDKPEKEVSEKSDNPEKEVSEKSDKPKKETPINSGKSKEDNMMDDEGEDLPDNFFDDFSNHDFMAGLDIVDDWMDEDEDPEGDEYFQDDTEIRARSFERDRGNYRRPRGHSRPNYIRRSPIRRHRDNERHRHFERSRDREFSSRRSRSRGREIDRRRSSRDHLRDERRSRERQERRSRERENRRSREREDRRSREREDRRSREREDRRSREREERRSRDRERRSRERESSRPREEKRSSDNANSHNSKNKPVEEHVDARRDPEKTKRDIQRDKIRCAKDFEARVFQEQIKVAESGLVPPGTELDVVLEHEKRKQEELQQAIVERPAERPKEEPHNRPERKRSFDKFRDSARSKSHGGRSSHDFLNRDRPSRDHPTREFQSREHRSRDRHSRERRSRERLSRERRSRERRSRERRSRERRSRERHIQKREREIRERRHSSELRSRSRKREHVRSSRSRDRSLSPRLHHRKSRSLDREELMRRNDDLRLRIREKRREKLINELSPVSEARFSRSPSISNLSLISNISEHLGSPRRKRSRKASFMEEIERKLRAKKASASNHYPNVLKGPPQPVPPPQQFPQQMPLGMQFQPQIPSLFAQGMVPNPYSNPQVDPGMMMMHQHQHQHQPMPVPGPGMPVMNMMGPPDPRGMMGGAGMMEQPMMPMPMPLMVNPMPMQVQQPPLNSPVKLDSSLHRTASNLKPCVSEANKEVTKLFEEQKISLSDYLSVSAKPIDPKMPISVHKKIKVISKCQDVIRVLKEDSKFCGRFFPKPSPPGVQRPEEKSVKWKSPLRKTFPVRFLFTTPCKKTPSQQEFIKNIINKLLFVCGIPAVPVNPAVQNASTKKVSASTSANPIPYVSLPKSMPSTKTLPSPVSFSVAPQKPKHFLIPQQPPAPVVIKRSTVGSQTEPVKCQICEIRSARKFSDATCQTRAKEMVDETTQVTIEDLQKSMVTFTPRGILKNSGSSFQSISHLTTAQLLALQKEKNDDGWNIPSRNETFTARTHQEQFTSPGNFMGRSSGSGPMSANFNSNPSLNRMTSLSSSGSGGGNFNSGFGGGLDKPFISNRPFSNQTSSMGSGTTMGDFQNMGNRGLDNRPGTTMGDFQNMGNRVIDNRPGNFDRFPNDRYSPEDSFKEPGYNNRNMGMSTNIAGRGRGGGTPAQGRGGWHNMGNFGGPNRPFYN